MVRTILGVMTNTSSDSRFWKCVLRNSAPKIGTSPKRGNLLRDFVIRRSKRPPMIKLSPSFISTRLTVLRTLSPGIPLTAMVGSISLTPGKPEINAIRQGYRRNKIELHAERLKFYRKRILQRLRHRKFSAGQKRTRPAILHHQRG